MNNVESAAAQSEILSGQHQVILATLQSLLESPHFSKSKRYPALLEFAVRTALDEGSNTLKERTVGIKVFGRPLNYDTSGDAVVRVAAGEVRRRMALYFSEHPEAPVRIDLPVGSYKAEFHFQPAALEKGTLQGPQPQAFVETMPSVPETVVENEPQEHVDLPLPVVEPQSTPRRWSAGLVAVLSVVLLLALAGAGWWHYLGTRGKQDFWWPVLHNDAPALILVGKRSVSAPAKVAGATSETTAPDSGTQSELVLDDAVVTAQICSVFREYNHDCSVGQAQMSKVEDIRNKSVVVVGGFNNTWTQRLLAPLPYQMQIDHVNQKRLIVEHKPTGDLPLGGIGFEERSQADRDYAIIGRFRSDITDGMAVVIAGLGVPGTASAGQYLSSPEKLSEVLALAPKDWKGVNFEAVLKIDVVQGSAGHVEVIASRFW